MEWNRVEDGSPERFKVVVLFFEEYGTALGYLSILDKWRILIPFPSGEEDPLIEDWKANIDMKIEEHREPTHWIPLPDDSTLDKKCDWKDE